MSRSQAPLSVGLLLALGGCAPNIISIRWIDLPAGYLKSAQVLTKPHPLSRIVTQYVVVEGKRVAANEVDASDPRTRTYRIPSSFAWKADKITPVEVRTEYRPLGFLWRKTRVATAEIVPAEAGRIEVEHGDDCLHDGDIAILNARLAPSPELDVVPLTLDLVGNCLTQDSFVVGAGTAQAKLRARCEGTAEADIAAKGRSQIPLAVSQWTIKPALLAPANLKIRQMGIVPPEAGDTEVGGGPQAPVTLFRQVEFSWSFSKPPAEIAVEIWREGAQRADQASLIGGANSNFTSGLAVGSRYYAKLRASYDYCRPGEMSPTVQTPTFDVR